MMNNYNLANSLFDYFQKEDLLIAYLSDFSDLSLLALTDIIHIYDDQNGAFGGMKTKIIYLIIEAFQNVIRYGNDSEVHKFFAFRKLEEDYYITTANTVEVENVIKLKRNIDDLNNLSAEELKEKYRETLSNRDFSEKGGAGLGFIEMLRKTKHNIEYFFEHSSYSESIFYFQIKYLTNFSGSDSLQNERNFYKFLIANNIIALLKFKYSEEISEALARLTLEMSDKKHDLLFHIVVEMMQNSSIQGVAKNTEQIFMIQQIGQSHKISTSRLVDNSLRFEVENTLNRIKNMSKKELNDFYIGLMELENIELEKLIGFVEIARKTEGFNYFFVPNTENESMFILNCLV